MNLKRIAFAGAVSGALSLTVIGLGAGTASADDGVDAISPLIPGGVTDGLGGVPAVDRERRRDRQHRGSRRAEQRPGSRKPWRPRTAAGSPGARRRVLRLSARTPARDGPLGPPRSPTWRVEPRLDRLPRKVQDRRRMLIAATNPAPEPEAGSHEHQAHRRRHRRRRGRRIRSRRGGGQLQRVGHREHDSGNGQRPLLGQSACFCSTARVSPLTRRRPPIRPPRSLLRGLDQSKTGYLS